MVPLVVAGGLLALLVFLAASFVLRRYLLTHSGGAFDCSMRKERARDSGGWMMGVARYEPDRLDWFRVFAVSPRPRRTLSRARLVVLGTREVQRGEGYAVVPGSVVVRCGYGQALLEFAMSEPDYNGFAAWIESAPPGTPGATP